LGGDIKLGHRIQNISGADVLVKSTAIPNHNVEVVAAEQAHIPVIPRAEMLAELMRMKYGVAVAGTHGKTTTTSMLATCMYKANLDPTVVIGGRLNSLGSSARLGEGPFMVAEADESDGSFMKLSPTVAIITNIDPEHMSHWKSEEALIRGFQEFAQKVPFFGFVALCLDHPVVQSIIPSIRRKIITYGMSFQADVRAENIAYDRIHCSFDVIYRGQNLGTITMDMPGEHNISNALACIAVCLELEIPFAQIQEGLNGFTGVDRRFSVRANLSHPEGEITIIDDYGHHPVEIEATLSATAMAWPKRRILAICQPHRYTRVEEQFAAFCRCFNRASLLFLTPIYRAGEKPIEGITHEALAQGIRDHGHRSVYTAPSLEDIQKLVCAEARPGDVIITLGAGDVNTLCTSIADDLR
jgi:UDP-N-acetylmuramate--alanine ligase